MRALLALTIGSLMTTTAFATAWGYQAIKDSTVPAFQNDPAPIMMAQADNVPASEPAPVEAAPIPVPASESETDPEIESATPAPEEDAVTAGDDSPPAFAAPSWTPMTEQQAMATADAYLKNLKSMRARFQQISADGMIMSGTAYLKKPGRARFDYDDPSPMTIIADGFWVALLDHEAGTQDRYPLNATPLALLLTDKAKISDEANLTLLEQGENLLRLHLQSREEPGLGTLILTFTKDPVTMMQWTVIDAQGYRTQVLLSGMEQDVAVDPALFRIDTLQSKDPRR